MEEEVLQPSPLRGGDPEPPKRGKRPGKGLWIALGVILAGLGVIVWLSRQAPPAPPPAPTPTPVPEPTATPDPALRQRAEAALEAMLELKRPVEAARPELWGGETWDRLRELSDAGDRALADKNYEQAAARYREAMEPARGLHDRLGELPGELFPEAEQAYGAGDRERAVGLLEAVLSVDPEHAAAADLLPRAQTADRSFAMLEKARGLAGSGELDLAWVELGRLEELDRRFPGYAELLNTVNESLAETEFQAWISKAILAVEEQKLEEAKPLLARAAAARPEHPAVKSLEAQIRDLETQREVLALREKALSLEERGEWRAAHEVWLRISSLDPHTPWVKEGLARTLKWKLVEEKLDRAEANPGSVQTGVWVEELFQDRQSWPEGLDRRAAKVVETWKLLQTPVPVTIESDAETTVMIANVGKWKPFVSRELELKPGSYVAKGIRLGYRDVRVPFEVKPGGGPVTVRVVCTEGI